MPENEARQRSYWPIVLGLVIAEVALTFEITMIYAALPRLNAIFHNRDHVGWLVTVFMMVSAGAAAVGGRLGDIYGRRRVVLVALMIATCGSMISGLSGTLAGVLLGRTLQGVAACVLPLSIGLVRDHLPSGRTAIGIGVVLSSASIGYGAGNLVGGYVIDHFDWPALFHVTAVLAGVGWAAVYALVPPDRDARRVKQKLDVLGGALFVPGIALIIYGLTEMRTKGWLDVTACLPVAAGLVLLAIWFWVEMRSDAPLVDVRAVFRGQVGIANLVMALSAATMYQMVLIGSLMMQQPPETGIGFGKTATFYGSVTIPGALLAVLASPLAGALAGRFGAGAVLLTAFSINVPLWCLMVLNASSLVWVCALMTAVTVIGAVVLTCVPNLIIESIDSRRTGEFVGFAVVLRHLFGGVGAQLAVSLLAGRIEFPAGSHVMYPGPVAYFTLFGLYGVAGLIMLGLVSGMKSKALRTSA